METKNKEVGFVVSYVDRKTRKRVGFLGPSKLRNALRVSCTRNQQEVVRYSSVCLSFRFFCTALLNLHSSVRGLKVSEDRNMDIPYGKEGLHRHLAPFSPSQTRTNHYRPFVSFRPSLRCLVNPSSSFVSSFAHNSTSCTRRSICEHDMRQIRSPSRSRIRRFWCSNHRRLLTQLGPC